MEYVKNTMNLTEKQALEVPGGNGSAEKDGEHRLVLMAEKGDIDDITAMENVDVFAPWRSALPTRRAICALTVMENSESSIAAYRSTRRQDDWTPDNAASLWALAGDPTVEFPDWSQPIGAHDAYDAGAKVSYGGKHWVSDLDDNVWVPGVYGWTEV